MTQNLMGNKSTFPSNLTQVKVNTLQGRVVHSLPETLRSIPTFLHRAWSSLTEAQKSLDKVCSAVEVADQLIETMVPLENDFAVGHAFPDSLLKSIEIFRSLYISEVWKPIDQLRFNFFSKMMLFRSKVDAFMSIFSKGLSHLINDTVNPQDLLSCVLKLPQTAIAI